MNTKYFYLWKNHVANTCFGITSNPENRLRKYEGHCGVPVKFDYLFEGPSNLIEDLEDRLKDTFWDHLFNKYEWVRGDAYSFDEVVAWVEWEIENTYDNLIVPAGKKVNPVKPVVKKMSFEEKIQSAVEEVFSVGTRVLKETDETKVTIVECGD